MAMFEGVADLTLAMLNEATQAWGGARQQLAQQPKPFALNFVSQGNDTR